MNDLLDELEGLCTQWSERCSQLSRQAKYWEAGYLNEARRELGDMIKAHREKKPTRLSTDQAIRDAYERVKQQIPLHQTNPAIPGMYPMTRVVD